jgi:hypothetical protein
LSAYRPWKQSAAEGFTARTRAAAASPSLSAVCMGTDSATKRARRTRASSNGSTDRSSAAGRKPARRRKAAGQATPCGEWPSS